VAVLLSLDSVTHAVWAQTTFGRPRPNGAEPQVGGIVGWLVVKQSEFYCEPGHALKKQGLREIFLMSAFPR
jgi:nickel/cobalt exporter